MAMDEELKANVKKLSTWIRLIYMIFFVVFFNVAELVAGLVVMAQFLTKLLTGRVNKQLSVFGQSLGIYLSKVVWFLTFHSENMPYPFHPWPSKAGGRAKALAAQKKGARPQIQEEKVRKDTARS
jgi:cellulose synthase/poly-beta-1,6-N-acetylglucosamine synthase-like glycosyltransferase